MKQVQISAVVRTFNEEKNIRDCLESLRWADEIIVVDSESTDRTRDIAREYTDRVIVQSWLGHIGQSQFATDQASNRWILHMDADERVTSALRDEIRGLDLDATPCDAFEIPRLHYFMQRWIRHSAWYPDRKIRLFRKDRCRWGGYAPHDVLLVPGILGRLRSDILHYIYTDLSHFLATKNTYSTLTAEDHFRNGRRANLADITLRPLYAFLYRYLVRLGFLDGLAGFVISVLESHAVFLKYAKLLELQRKLKRFDRGSSEEPRS